MNLFANADTEVRKVADLAKGDIIHTVDRCLRIVGADATQPDTAEANTKPLTQFAVCAVDAFTGLLVNFVVDETKEFIASRFK